MTSVVDWSNPRLVARLIDHTLLKPEATRRDVEKICAEAAEYGFASVCINPFWVGMAAQILRGSEAKVCTVIGFPLGANESRIKMAEAKLALEQGAHEIDMVQNVGALRSGDHEFVLKEIAELAHSVHAGGGILKVILENCLLTDQEKITACALARDAAADFVKTSTGFSTGGATIADVELMRRTVGERMGVKASGGIRSLEQLRVMVEVGANRIGASAGVAIMKQLQQGAVAAASGPSEVNSY